MQFVVNRRVVEVSELLCVVYLIHPVQVAEIKEVFLRRPSLRPEYLFERLLGYMHFHLLEKVQVELVHDYLTVWEVVSIDRHFYATLAHHVE